MKTFREFLNESPILEQDFLSKYKIKQVQSGLGFSEDNQKWYGWSHRGLYGFGIGDKLFDKNWTPDGSKPGLDNKSTENLKFADRGSKTINTLEQAKEAAINFRKYISG